MAEVVLEAQALSRHYAIDRGWFRPKAILRALDGVSFSLTAQQTLAVVGESGCGKSTLARQLTLIETPSSGRLWLAGREVTDWQHTDAATRRYLRRQVQMVFQNPYASLNPRQKIGRILSEPLKINTTLNAEEREATVRQIMEKVGLRPEHYQRYPHMFSGGQRQRVAIARALMLRPQVVIADEPVSALDVSIQAQVLNLLLDLQAELGIAYVFISHDLAVVRHIADQVLVMYLGRPVEQGEARAIFEQPLHPYSRALLASVPRLRHYHAQPDIHPVSGELPSPLNPPSGCAFHTRCSYASPECSRVRPELRAVQQRWVACHHAERFC